jgi:hypothetical protein
MSLAKPAINWSHVTGKRQAKCSSSRGKDTDGGLAMPTGMSGNEGTPRERGDGAGIVVPMNRALI